MTRTLRTQRRLVDELPELFRAAAVYGGEGRPRTLRELAAATGVNQSYLSRIRHGAKQGRPVSKEIAARIAEAFGLPHDYFAEYRAAAVIEAARSDPSILDDAYDKLKRSRRLPPRS